MQCLDDQCRSHLGTKPKDLRLPLVCEEKDVLSSLDVFRGGSFCLQFFSRVYFRRLSNRLHKHVWEQMHGPLFCLNVQAVAWPLRKVAQCLVSTIGIKGVRINKWKYLFDKGA